MDYEIRLTDEAECHFIRMPEWVQRLTDGYLRELAHSPSSESRTVVSPPYPVSGGMVAETDLGPIDGTIYHITVFFRYSQDETTLIVTGIGHFKSV
jgi:hypothetical protein